MTTEAPARTPLDAGTPTRVWLVALLTVLALEMVRASGPLLDRAFTVGTLDAAARRAGHLCRRRAWSSRSCCCLRALLRRARRPHPAARLGGARRSLRVVIQALDGLALDVVGLVTVAWPSGCSRWPSRSSPGDPRAVGRRPSGSCSGAGCPSGCSCCWARGTRCGSPAGPGGSSPSCSRCRCSAPPAGSGGVHHGRQPADRPTAPAVGPRAVPGDRRDDPGQPGVRGVPVGRVAAHRGDRARRRQLRRCGAAAAARAVGGAVARRCGRARRRSGVAGALWITDVWALVAVAVLEVSVGFVLAAAVSAHRPAPRGIPRTAAATLVVGVLTIAPLLLYMLDYDVPLRRRQRVGARRDRRRARPVRPAPPHARLVRALRAAPPQHGLRPTAGAARARAGRHRPGRPVHAGGAGPRCRRHPHARRLEPALRRLAPDRVSSSRTSRPTIEAQHPDVVTLQEVERGWIFGGGADMATWLSRRLDMTIEFAPAADRQFGNAVLARSALTDVAIHQLPYGDGPQHRSALATTLTTASGASLRVTSVHLQHRASNTPTRLEQLHALAAAEPVTPPAVLAGDLNATPGSPEITFLTRRGLGQRDRPGRQPVRHHVDQPRPHGTHRLGLRPGRHVHVREVAARQHASRTTSRSSPGSRRAAERAGRSTRGPRGRAPARPGPTTTSAAVLRASHPRPAGRPHHLVSTVRPTREDPGLMSARHPLPSRPVADPRATVVGETFRITVLTDGLVRLEQSPDGVFEDRASTFALHRDLPVPDFRGASTATRARGASPTGCTSPTTAARSRTSGLQRRRCAAASAAWHSALALRRRPATSLGGTARTLDVADGARPARARRRRPRGGVAVLDDSGSFLLDRGRLGGAPRPAGDSSTSTSSPTATTTPAPLRALLRGLRRPSRVLPAVGARQLVEPLPPLLRRRATPRCSTGSTRSGSAFSVAVLDMDWHRVESVPPEFGSGWTGYSWERELFPDPAGVPRRRCTTAACG